MASASSAMLCPCTETLRSRAFTLVAGYLLALTRPRNSPKAHTIYTLSAVARSPLRTIEAAYFDPLTNRLRRRDDMWYVYDKANRFTASRSPRAA
jgi:hypothetical protein